MQAEDEGAIEEELGDVLFVIANLSTYYHINPEIALQRTNRKFISRFQFIEKSVAASKREITTVSQAEMDEYWDQAKRSEEHTSELQSRGHLVCRLLLEKKKYT